MVNDDEAATQSDFFSMVTGPQEESPVAEQAIEDKHHLPQPLPQESVAAVESKTLEGSDMPHEARRVIVHLMKQGVIIAAQKSKLFEQLCRYETLVRRHLAEVYLKLVLDSRAGVAFVASYDNEFAAESASETDEFAEADESEDEFVTLITKRTLTLYDTLVLLVLRKHYQERESAGEQKIIIDIERLESYLTPFLPLTDHSSLDRKKLVARVKEMVRRKVLATVRGTEDRYEITPIIRYVVDASFLESMLEEYKQLAADAAPMVIQNSSAESEVL